MEVIASEQATLIENLRSAFEVESDAHARYVDFAEKAEGEGWHGVASLFRAAAFAEDIHFGNHGRILRQLGGDIEIRPHAAEVRVTLDNLRVALAGELFEVDTMYPAFLHQAQQCRDVAVVRTFTWALEAEKTHARLFNEALTLVELEDEDAWITMPRSFYVCPVCGYSSEDRNEAEMCRVCNCAWKRFEEIR